MKNIVLLIAFFLTAGLLNAQKYSSKTGKVVFEASVPMFEDILATDNLNTAILNADTGEIASVSAVKNFHFKKKLMEEHFNENYAETAKYPKATFKGKILNFNKTKLASPTNYSIQGSLNFHGVERPVTSAATIYAKDGKIYIKGSFITKTADYNVTIPTVVTKKIAEKVNVEYDFVLAK